MTEVFDTSQVNVSFSSFHQMLIFEEQVFLNYFDSHKTG